MRSHIKEALVGLSGPAVGDIVERQRLTGVDRSCVLVEQPHRRQLLGAIEHVCADQLLTGEAVDFTRGIVRVLVDKLHDPARLVA
jgi:hypothetical protein